ncbi:hypothetical protein F2Q69_00036862 [Brassica cretica]|uniref:Uncharacterized protein n=1 Tax=Brassica cretica TaxID=69181 RepID=A0A8S9SI81_BRACR|nr:hypothetical protein F2Q69_00036862 [Brassica cretica]
MEVRASRSKRRSLDESYLFSFDRAVYVLGRYVASELGSSSVATSRPSCVRAQSLRSDRAWLELVCVLGRYIATELGWSSVATSRPSCVRARSLRSDRAWLELGRYVATEPCACSVAT